MKNKRFLDVGCKVGGSFTTVSKKFGFKEEEGLGIDINENNVKIFNELGFDGVVAKATDLPFEDGEFELVIFSHVLEHLPDYEQGIKALYECIRVSNKYVFISLPFFDEDEYLNSLGFKTYYSDWTGHKNMIHLKTLREILSNYKYELKMIKKIHDSTFDEILPIESIKNSHRYNPEIHKEKQFVKFERDIWREYSILIKK